MAKMTANGKPASNVLTLEEVAEFIRVPLDKLRALVDKGIIPGRNVAGEWRFWRGALIDWLSAGEDGKTKLLRQAGAFRDDQTLPELIKHIYRAKGHSKAELKQLVEQYPVVQSSAP